MSDAQDLLYVIAVAALCVAVLAGWREHRRRRRADPDAVGWIDWTLVQVIALIVAAIAGWVALKA
ncbi:hypothetical protein [Sphingomonas sp. NPDC079357]|uniref:hypothetical protein n=1 Tax=Sphingomonas sp. NPDC079357 TaxID=3364518 RepID=UPI00384FE205